MGDWSVGEEGCKGSHPTPDHRGLGLDQVATRITLEVDIRTSETSVKEQHPHQIMIRRIDINFYNF